MHSACDGLRHQTAMGYAEGDTTFLVIAPGGIARSSSAMK